MEARTTPTNSQKSFLTEANCERALTYMMLDADVVAVSPSSTYRVLKAAGVMDRWNRQPSSKGKGFVQPKAPHKHWRIDIRMCRPMERLSKLGESKPCGTATRLRGIDRRAGDELVKFFNLAEQIADENYPLKVESAAKVR